MTVRAAPRGLNQRLARDVDAAFPALVERHVDGLYSGIRRFVPSQSDAEDLTQETLLRAYRALSGYDSARIESIQLRPWLWTIAINLCRSAARRRARRVTEVDLGAALHVDPAPDSTEGDAVDAVMQEQWSHRLATLSGPQRTAVVLRHVVDLPYAEISEVTGRPIGTVKADVHRGLDRLRQMIDAESGSIEKGQQ